MLAGHVKKISTINDVKMLSIYSYYIDRSSKRPERKAYTTLLYQTANLV